MKLEHNSDSPASVEEKTEEFDWNSPIKKGQDSQKHYSSEKIEKITHAISGKKFHVNVGNMNDVKF